MREAIGGTFLVKLLMMFLVVYVIFIAMALNYAKAFKAKNSIVDFIEKYEGYNNLSKPAIDEYIKKFTYQVSSQTLAAYAATAEDDFPDITALKCDPLGYCIEEYEEDGKAKARVVTFIEFRFFDIDDNYNYTSVIRYPSLHLKAEIRKYSPDKFWNDTY